MQQHVAAGSEIDEVIETRRPWSDEHDFHYDIRVEIHGTPVYIEIRLNYRIPLVPDESWILVVNVHAP